MESFPAVSFPAAFRREHCHPGGGMGRCEVVSMAVSWAAAPGLRPLLVVGSCPAHRGGCGWCSYGYAGCAKLAMPLGRWAGWMGEEEAGGSGLREGREGDVKEAGGWTWPSAAAMLRLCLWIGGPVAGTPYSCGHCGEGPCAIVGASSGFVSDTRIGNSARGRM